MINSKCRQYPPQTGEYAVKVKNGSAWHDYDTCRLQISVGQEYHEGAKMEATLNWAGQRFRNVIICVNDTLQRYNSIYSSTLGEEDAHKEWSLAGQSWIERNRPFFQSLQRYSIVRWDDWIFAPEFNKKKEEVELFYTTNSFFREAIQQNINDFWQRNAQRINGSAQAGYGRFFECSRAYLLEETAVFSMMFKLETAVDIYPGTVLLPAVLFRSNPVPGMPEGLDLGCFTRIDFKRNPIPHVSMPQENKSVLAA